MMVNIILKVKEIIENLIKRHCYDDVFLNLETMNVPIDTFFDKILVMVEDEKIRSNRLALLRTIADLYFSVADLTKIALAKGTIKGESI
jgi:glycyl-tRNA synthetase beta chain